MSGKNEDERIKQDMDDDLVGSRDDRRAPQQRDQSRAASNRDVAERRDLSDDDRINMFREQFFNDALPDLPPIPGYRTFWATTTNPRDTIQRRLQLGYEFITQEDVPGYDHVTLRTGEYAGIIGVNEMLAMKLPERLWQAYMQEAHHNAPKRDEERIRESVELMQEQAKAAKGALITEEGYEELREQPLYGKFT